MGLGKCHRVLKSVNAVCTSLYIGPIKEVEYQCTLFLHLLSTWADLSSAVFLDIVSWPCKTYPNRMGNVGATTSHTKTVGTLPAE